MRSLAHRFGITRGCDVALVHSSASACLRLCGAVRGIKFFDRLIPEDSPELKKEKAMERAIIKKKLARSKFAEMLSVPRDKVCLMMREEDERKKRMLLPSRESRGRHRALRIRLDWIINHPRRVLPGTLLADRNAHAVERLPALLTDLSLRWIPSPDVPFDTLTLVTASAFAGDDEPIYRPSAFSTEVYCDIGAGAGARGPDLPRFCDARARERRADRL